MSRIPGTHDWRTQLSSLHGAYSADTIRSYRSHFATFEAWCHREGHSPLPASTNLVSRYVAALAKMQTPATVRGHVAAISRIHRMFDYADPGKGETVRIAIRRLLMARGRRQKQVAGLRSELRDALINSAGVGLVGARDRALVSAGYDTLCRRSELVALLVEDITEAEDGSGTVLVRRSKADQLGYGRVAFLSPRSIALLRRWLELAGIDNGPIFRGVRGSKVLPRPLSAQVVTQVVKRAALRAGLAAELVSRLSGHSFRVGAALDMTEHGIDLVPIMHAGGWKSPDMVVRYTQQINARRSGMAVLHDQKLKSHPPSSLT